MIISVPEDRISAKDIIRIRNCMVFNSYPLMVFLVGLYIENNPNKSYILRQEDEKILKCINQIISNYRVNKIHITSNLFSEFLNHIRKFYKNDYKTITCELIEDLKDIEEIYIEKNKSPQNTYIIT